VELKCSKVVLSPTTTVLPSNEDYQNCKNTNEMKMLPSNKAPKNKKKERKNIFGASSGFEPMTSAMVTSSFIVAIVTKLF